MGEYIPTGVAPDPIPATPGVLYTLRYHDRNHRIPILVLKSDPLCRSISIQNGATVTISLPHILKRWWYLGLIGIPLRKVRGIYGKTTPQVIDMHVGDIALSIHMELLPPGTTFMVEYTAKSRSIDFEAIARNDHAIYPADQHKIP